VYRVICADEDAMHWPEEDIGNMRVALNALVRVFPPEICELTRRNARC
jgi:hypothetical protein